MASFFPLHLRRILLVSAIGLSGAPAFAQQSVIPNVVTGLDANGGQKTQAVGTGADGLSVPMPVSVQASPTGTGTIVPADVVTLPGGSAITMFATGHCANGCRVSVPVAFATNALTVATATATTGGNEVWPAGYSVPIPPTPHAVSVFSTTASTASGVGSTIP